jgi:hypothetical protein
VVLTKISVVIPCARKNPHEQAYRDEATWIVIVQQLHLRVEVATKVEVIGLVHWNLVRF